jgi:hypothetical protein
MAKVRDKKSAIMTADNTFIDRNTNCMGGRKNGTVNVDRQNIKKIPNQEGIWYREREKRAVRTTHLKRYPSNQSWPAMSVSHHIRGKAQDLVVQQMRAYTRSVMNKHYPFIILYYTRATNGHLDLDQLG